MSFSSKPVAAAGATTLDDSFTSQGAHSLLRCSPSKSSLRRDSISLDTEAAVTDVLAAVGGEQAADAPDHILQLTLTVLGVVLEPVCGM